MIIDAHAHYVPPTFLDEVVAQKRSFPSVKVAVADGGHRFAFADNDPKRPMPGGMSDADGRKRWLAARGIDRQVVGGWLDLFGYDIPADEGADWSRYLNAHMLAGVKPYPFLCRSRRCRCNPAGMRRKCSRKRSTPVSTAP